MTITGQSTVLSNQGLIEGLHDIEGLRQEINLHTEWMEMFETPDFVDTSSQEELDEKLDQLCAEVGKSSLLRVEFPKRYTTYASHFDGLLAAMGVNTESDQTVGAVIPRERIQLVRALSGRESVGLYRPRLLLKIDTHPTEVGGSGQADLEERVGSWHDFGLGTVVSIKGFFEPARSLR